MEDALANWQWLVAAPDRGDALVLLRDSAAPDFALATGYARVVRLPFDVPWSQTVAEGSMDCVALPDSAVLHGGGAPAVATLRALLATLRPSTGVYVGIEEIHGSDRMRTPMSLLRAWRRRQAPLLRRAGFRDVRTYFVVQSPEAPRHLVPDTPQALTAWEAAVSLPDWRSRLRSALYRLGLAAVVLRYRLVLARS